MTYRSDLMLPIGADPEWVSGSGYFTRVLRTDSGRESRNQEWDQTLSRYVMRFNARNKAIWEQIADMFDAAAGRAHSWPLRDPRHNVATGAQGRFEVISPTSAFMVVRKTFGSSTFERHVKPAAGPVFVGGSGVSYSFTTGLLTYATLPTSWAGPYYICVRFDADELEITGIDREPSGNLIAGYRDIPIQEVRDE